MLEMMIALLVTIKASGVPFINYTIYLNPNSTLVTVNLPSQPIQGTLEVVNDSDGSLIPASLYSNGSLSIFAFGGGYVSVLYYANYTINQETLTYYFNLTSPIKFGLAFPSNIVILNLPSTVLSYERINNSVEVMLPPGQYGIQYVYVPATQQNKSLTTSTTATTATPVTRTASPQSTSPTTSTSSAVVPPVTSSTEASSKSQSSTPTTRASTLTQSSGAGGETRDLAIIVTVAILVAIGALVAYWRRKQNRPVLEALDDVDQAILNALRENGGSLYQSQLQQLTNIPKTTLWRHVQRLQERGLVRVEKVGGQNKVILR
ncbi:hypothetical protein GCM10007981_18280 [Thermocladium modestius]|uniref:Winged helix-turn-helix transcriptional regulator n=1 Tax=Thermocladium modestius TaxID=62609 RepID=A0A830GXT3_9CREN|nr:winged helix-turn-helix transcriptional regulator [Thermocladium modestius]GGP22394.1 hypothetical protein GCM10007981_18280 [Thermocladium modestius]